MKENKNSLDNTINLRLVETHTFGLGVVYLRYQLGLNQAEAY
jgi:hypothetical protein